MKLEINYVPCMLLYNSNCVLVRNYKPLLALYKLQTIPRMARGRQDTARRIVSTATDKYKLSRQHSLLGSRIQGRISQRQDRDETKKRRASLQHVQLLRMRTKLFTILQFLSHTATASEYSIACS